MCRELTKMQKIALEIHYHCQEQYSERGLYPCGGCELSSRDYDPYEDTCIVKQVNHVWWETRKKKTPLQLKARKLLLYCKNRACTGEYPSDKEKRCDLLQINGNCMGYFFAPNGNEWHVPRCWELSIAVEPLVIMG